MNIFRRDEDGVAILALRGRLDQASADEVHRAAMEPVGEGCRGIVVDMSGVDYIASVGIRSLIRPSQGIALKGGKLAVAALKPEIKDFFKLTGLDQMFSVYETPAEAVAALR
jgi:anti-anti-sigma factor